MLTALESHFRRPMTHPTATNQPSYLQSGQHSELHSVAVVAVHFQSKTLTLALVAEALESMPVEAG